MKRRLSLCVLASAALILLVLPWSSYGAPKHYYYVHVASFRSQSNAEISAKELRRLQVETIVRKEDVPKKGEWYRLYFGPYFSRQEAESKGRELRQKNAIKYSSIQKRDLLFPAPDSAEKEPVAKPQGSRDPSIIHEKVRVLAGEGKYIEALRLLQPFVLRPSEFPKLYSDYLAILVWEGRGNEAIDLFEALPEAFPRRPYLLSTMAGAYYEKGQFSKAAPLYRTVIADTPSNEDAQKGLVRSQLKAGNLENALEDVNRFLEMSPISLPLLSLKAEIRVAQGRYFDAFRVYDLLRDKPGIDPQQISRSKERFILSLSPEQKERILEDLGDHFQKGDQKAGMDYMSLLVWTKDYRAAINAFETTGLALQDYPDHIVLKLAWTYFKTGQSEKAKGLYHAILREDPDHVQANTGLAYCLAQEREDQKAMSILDRLLVSHPEDREIRFARAFAHEKAGRFWAAVLEYDHLLKSESGDLTARKLRLRALSDMGASSLAFEQAQSAFPEGEDLHRDFLGDMVADRIHWGEPKAAMDMLWPQAEDKEDVRVRYDYIAALSERGYMQEAVNAYEALLEKGVPIPWWIHESVAKAYLYVEQPEKALVHYDKALEMQPDSFDSRMGRFYTLQELRTWEEARALLDALDTDTSASRGIGGKGPAYPNWSKLEIAVARGWFDLYQGRLKEGQQFFEDLREKAPADMGIRNGLVHSYLFRGWPRRALKGFDIMETVRPEAFYQHQTGRVEALNQLAFKQEARDEASRLLVLHPRDRHLQRLVRKLQVEDMHELSTEVFVEKEEEGTRDIQMELALSTPISPYTRLYGLTFWQEIEDDNRFSKFRRAGLGIDHIFNHIFSIKQQFSAGYEDGEDFGSFTLLHINPTDEFFLSMGYDSFSTDVPMRARVFGIEAERMGVSVTFRESDWREYGLSLSRYTFSDGNNRDESLLGYEQGLYAKKDWKMRLFLHLSLSKNSLENTPYFNPESDWGLSVTHMTQHTVWDLYDRAFVHRLYLSAGNYRQHGFSHGFVGSIRYEQDHALSDTQALVGGVSVARDIYDGDAVNRINGYLTYRARF